MQTEPQTFWVARHVHPGMTTAYDLQNVRLSYRWLGHQPFHTELAALHPDYRPGPENAAWNREREAYPSIGYATNEAQVVGFVRRYAGSRMVCYSLNRRIGIRTEVHGFPVASRESDVKSSQNLLLDFDLEGEPSSERLTGLDLFLKTQVASFFQDHGLAPPERANSGGGCHLLAAYQPISLSKTPDISLRLRAFRDQVNEAFSWLDTR